MEEAVDASTVAEEVMASSSEQSSLLTSPWMWTMLALAVGGAAMFAYQSKSKKDKDAAGGEIDEVEDDTDLWLEVAKENKTTKQGVITQKMLDDVAVMVQTLSASNSQSHAKVLWALATTPGSITWGLQRYKIAQKIRAERQAQEDKLTAQLEEQAKQEASKGSAGFDLDDGGWDEEVENEDLAEKERLAEEAKKRARVELQKATGKEQAKLEGYDEGVIGQQWVETTLTSKGVWPPPDDFIDANKTFEYKGEQVSAMDHPGLRRNLCMIMGRLHSNFLNSHPELLHAGSKDLVDATYYQVSRNFRLRLGTLLEAALRAAVAARSTAWASTVVETVALFKIGCMFEGSDKTSTLEWFDGVMEKTYQCLPRLEIKDIVLKKPVVPKKKVVKEAEKKEEDTPKPEEKPQEEDDKPKAKGSFIYPDKPKAEKKEDAKESPDVADEDKKEEEPKQEDNVEETKKGDGEGDEEAEKDDDDDTDDPTLYTNQLVVIAFELTRLHAEAFTKQKIAMFQKQGIPPQMALQAYRESWWFLVSAERLQDDGTTYAPLDDLEVKTAGILRQVESKDLDAWVPKTDRTLLTAWPMVVQNVAQKSGRVAIQLVSPPTAGTYRFTVQVKSQDFLGADQEFVASATFVEKEGASEAKKE